MAAFGRSVCISQREVLMLTFFTTAKPFRGHNGVIQRNALKSWKLLYPDGEIILFGDDDGTADTARELNIRHEPHPECNKNGLSRVDYMIRHAQATARHEVLCCLNCDIMLMEDFRAALERVKAAHKRFLMVGRRWDTEVSEPYSFGQEDWQAQLRALALRCGTRRTPEWIDYFAFSRGLYGADVPALVIGRPFWDNWLVWKTLDLGQPVVDASAAVVAVHQNHDYRHHPQGLRGVLHGDEADWNSRLAGGWRHLRTIADATEVCARTD